MCGRVTIHTPAEELAREFGLVGVRAALERPRYNVPPTARLPVVANTGRRELDLYRWGLVPSWAKDISIGNRLSNARADTLAVKPSFRTAFRRRRCAVLVDGFYEWRRQGAQKTPFLFHRQDGRPMVLAGLWEEWKPPGAPEALRTCTIITTGANALMAPVHDRMPVVLVSPADMDTWLNPEPVEPAAVAHLLVPPPEDVLEGYEVDRVVNNAKNDVPACIAPIRRLV